MHASPSTRGTTRVTVLPDAGREEMLAAAGLSASAHWPELDLVEQGYSFEDAFEESNTEERGFLAGGGWTPVSKKNNKRADGGLTAHRGVLMGDEYIDYEQVLRLVEQELGFTIEQIHSVYRQGPLSAEQRELRGQIDARLLALSRADGNLLALARLIGWTIKEASAEGGASCDTMERAIARAREAETVAS